MKLQKFKENNKNQKVIIIFTIACVLLITGVFIYKTFAIFQTNLNEDIINGEVQDIGDLEFAFYIDDGKEDKISKTAPKKEEGYSLDTSSSYCKDMTTGEKVSRINWDNERWGPYLSNITTTKTKCYLHFKKIYEEDTLNGAIPDLMNGRLVPVVISEDEKPSDITYVGAQAGKVEKADITSEWYNYGKQQWANAVILRDGVVDNYTPGEEIKEKDIESYFVWIPRYRYVLQEDESTYTVYTSVTELGNKTNVTEVYEAMKATNKVGNKGESSVFEIAFETKDSGNKQGSKKGDSITHPAFEAFDSNGFWVGKFETGYNQNSDTTKEITTSNWTKANAENTSNTNKEEPSKVIIKPNVYSWRGIQIANAFYTSYNYKRELESHMMKNSEWGAVTYLTNSKFGRCTNEKCEEVRINNNSDYITGYSAKNVPTAGSPVYNSTDSTTLNQDGDNGYHYYNSSSVQSSTTGNYSGIYDMAGGAWDCVMGVMQGSNASSSPASGADSSNNSGFKGLYSNCKENGGRGSNCGENKTNTNGKEWSSSKYYDLYDYKTIDQEYQRGVLGDATKELGPFYRVSYNGGTSARFIGSYNADLAYFIVSSNPWFRRGGGYGDGTDSGVYAFHGVNGQADTAFSFRVVLSP